MRFFDIVAVLIGLSAVFSWLNERYLKLPTAIGLMFIALVMSLVLLLPLPFFHGFEQDADAMLKDIDFGQTLLHGMLAFLLFAGALHVNLNDLAKQKWAIGILATASVAGATLLIGGGAYLLFAALGIQMPLIYCLLFGALVSPTDPIAVLGILKSAGAPKSLETKITGESLFNDGAAVVLFLALLHIAEGSGQFAPGLVLGLFLKEVLGGLLLGLVAGGLAYSMLKRVDNYSVEVLITLALATGGYAIAEHTHVSAPIAVVVAGLLIGNQGRAVAMSERTIEHLANFWELVDQILNAVLFVLIGLEVLVIDLSGELLLAGLLAIPLALAARLVSVGLPIGVMRRFRSFSPGVVSILTWGGLRGGISVALALSLPVGEHRDILVTVTYVVVVFSVLVQGLTLGMLVRAKAGQASAETELGPGDSNHPLRSEP
jgi:CPA1 family monovalent cation:H+ antiporter